MSDNLHNTDERLVITGGLACLCGLGAAAAMVPALGYVLLGVVLLGIAGLIGLGAWLWWDTRYQDPHRHTSTEPAPGVRVRQEVA